jgi:hypothetical protein
MRITLVHALKHSLVPIEESFARLWPETTRVNLLDDSLSADLARDGRLTEAMTDRFLALGRYAAATGADAILFTCSAFGPCIEAVARAQAPMPVLKPNEAMIELAVAQATGQARRIGLLSNSCRNSRKGRSRHSIAAIAMSTIGWSWRRRRTCATAT